MSYRPLNNVTTADQYTEANTIACPGARRINFDVAGAAIYYQLGDGQAGQTWRSEVFLPPGFRSLDRLADAVRIRSAVSGIAANVTVEAVPASELPHAA